MPEEKKIPKHINFIFGGLSGTIAACFVHPLDMVKNHMQLSNMGTLERTTTLKTAVKIFKGGGISHFYYGITAAMLRQVTYGSSRIGTYITLQQNYVENHKTLPPLYLQVFFGCVAGTVGGILGTPAELVLIRMTADSHLPVKRRRNYAHALNAISRVISEEGAHVLFRGLSMSVARGVVANAAELSAYSHSKSYFLDNMCFKDDVRTHILCSLIAVMANLSFSLPFDIAKTRIQHMNANVHGDFKEAIGLLADVIKKEGPTALWKGFTPSFACIAPRTVIMFVLVEEFSKLYKIYVLKDPTHPSSGF